MKTSLHHTGQSRPLTSAPRAGHRSRRPARPGRLGFTLVELLVVIGIIALLVSILLPSLSRAREQAKQIKCLSNLKQLSLATLMYCNNNKGFFPGQGGK